MKITRKDQKNSIVELTVVLDKKEFAAAEETALRKIATTVKVDGFRKGHVPESVVRSKVGEGAIKQEAIDMAISDGYMQALKQEKVNPIAQPEVAIEKMDPLEFKISVQVYPDVKLGKIDTSKVKLTASKVTKKEIDEQVEMICNQSAEKSPVTRKAKKGDTAVIDFDGKNAEGETQPGMKSAGHPLELGSGTFIPGFEEEVIGMKKDEEKIFPITFPKDYQSTDIAGKEFFFTVKVNDVLEKKLPKFDDEFAKKITGDDKKTADDLKEEIKGHLKKNKDDKKIAEITKNKDLNEVEFFGVLVYGKKSNIEKLTTKFPLLSKLGNSNSSEEKDSDINISGDFEIFEGGFNREKAWKMINSRCDKALQRHLAHVGASMEALAVHFGYEDEKEKWYLTGLLHDIDWNQTIEDDSKHCSEETMEYLRANGVSNEICEAIQSHHTIFGVPIDTPMKKALFACDEISGFSVAVALMRPTKMIGMTPKSVIKKLKDKGFAAAVSREDMKSCEQYFDMPVKEFLEILLPAWEKIAGEWELK